MLLTVGLGTRTAALTVLIINLIVFSWDSSYGKVTDKFVLANLILPFWMLFSRWGETYSLDALIRRKHGGAVVSPSADSWQYVWPQRAVLIFLCILYFSAGYQKLVPGSWSYNPYLLLDKIAKNAIPAKVLGLQVLPEIVYMASVKLPALFMISQYLVLLFELSFPLALINRSLRTLMLASAALFHLGAVILLDIAFIPQIIVLALFVDWQRLYNRFWPDALRLKQLPSNPMLIGLAVASILLAVGLGVVIAAPSTSVFVNQFSSLELLWFPIAPFAILVWRRAALELWRSRPRLLIKGTGG